MAAGLPIEGLDYLSQLGSARSTRRSGMAKLVDAADDDFADRGFLFTSIRKTLTEERGHRGSSGMGNGRIFMVEELGLSEM